MELEGQMNSLWDTAAHSPRSHRCFLQASNTLLVPVCQFASVSHSAGLEVKKKKKTVTRCNRVHSLQYPIHLSNLKGSRRRKVSLPRATRVLICYLDWGFHLMDAVFFGCRQSWIFFSSAASLVLMLCGCVPMVCSWSSSEWLPCRATLRAHLPQRIKPECQAHRENSSSEDQGEDKRVLRLNHYLVTEFNRRQNSVWHMQCI